MLQSLGGNAIDIIFSDWCSKNGITAPQAIAQLRSTLHHAATLCSDCPKLKTSKKLGRLSGAVRETEKATGALKMLETLQIEDSAFVLPIMNPSLQSSSHPSSNQAYSWQILPKCGASFLGYKQDQEKACWKSV